MDIIALIEALKYEGEVLHGIAGRQTNCQKRR